MMAEEKEMQSRKKERSGRREIEIGEFRLVLKEVVSGNCIVE